MRSWLVASVLAVLLAGGGWGAWQVMDNPVSSFVVKGEITVAQKATLERVLSEAEFRGVLSTPLGEVATVVRDLSWTRQVSVRRNWPNGFEIELRQAQPIARWGEDAYISAAGETLELPDQYPGLPRFDIALASPQTAMEAYRMLDQIASREGLTISALSQNPHGEWVVGVDDGLKVFLGSEALNDRMHRFLLVKRRVLAEADRPVEYVDARYASGVAVRFVEHNEEDAEETANALLAQNTSVLVE